MPHRFLCSLRISTDKQDAENQKLGILEYAAACNIQIDEFVEDIVSVSAIGHMMKVDRKTVSRYIKRHLPQHIKKKNEKRHFRVYLFYAMCKQPLYEFIYYSDC